MSGTLSEGRGARAGVRAARCTRAAAQAEPAPGSSPRVFATAEARWAFVVQRSRELRDAGRAVLITDTVADSQALSEAMHAAGLQHQLLNARHDRAEADVVAAAGAPGRITVATSMAGRGTDIALHPAVARRGGLHVILCQANPSMRIDLQFLGRCARRGAGSCETLYVLDCRLPRAAPSCGPPGLRPARAPRLGVQLRRERAARRACGGAIRRWNANRFWECRPDDNDNPLVVHGCPARRARRSDRRAEPAAARLPDRAAPRRRAR